MKRVCVISDTQIPFHDTRATANLVSFINTWRPDHVIHVGDLMDFPQPSSWSRDTRAEFEGSVFADSEAGKRFLGDIRRSYAGPFDVIEGNHDLRPRAYLAKYCPALAESKSMDLDVLLDFDSHGVNLVRGFLDLTPDWVVTHGHLGFSLNKIAGRTAALAALACGKSVVMGHTHRLGIVPESTGYAGKLKTVTGFEVGHLMDIRKADYVMSKRGAANWQQGFGVLYIDGKKVTPVAVPVFPDGSFVVDGYRFGK